MEVHKVLPLEIILIIGESLPQGTLATCIRVSKSWQQLLAPLLYKDITYFNSPRPSAEAMTRHAECIRHLTLVISSEPTFQDGQPNIFASRSSFRCHNLLSLDVVTLDIDREEARATCEALILLNQRLRHLRICSSSFGQPQLPWTIVFSKCGQFLQSLELVYCCLTEQDTAALMEIARRLKRLDLTHCRATWTELADAPQFTAMESLTIDGMFHEPLQELHWYRQCPQLQSIKWRVPLFAEDSLATKLAFRNLQSQPWHQLQRLELSYGLCDCQIAQILNACGPLRVVSVMQTAFWYRSLAALERHAQTLEGLRIYDGDMSSWMGQWILVTFPKLTHLKLGRVFAHEIVTGHGAEEAREHRVAEDTKDDIFYRQQEVEQDEDEMVDELNEIMARFAASRDLQRVKPWICLNLVQLTLFISFPTGARSGWDEQVFRQISKLDRLESLNLGQSMHIRDHSLHGGFYARGLDLRIQSGLTLLAPLKNLVTLRFSGTQQELDEQDLMWIMDQWPTLKEMSRDLHCEKEKRKALLRLVEARSIEPLVQAFEFEDENGEEEVYFYAEEDYHSDFIEE